ncbi:MAG: hypothetical protein ABIZ04_20595 [Opitutus sp.]
MHFISPVLRLAQFGSATAILALACLTVQLTSAASPGKESPKLVPPRAHKSIRGERDGQSVEEKELAALTRKLRLEDAAFIKDLRKASAGEKRNLRARRLELLEPSLRKMNELAIAIRSARGLSELPAGYQPMRPSTTPQPANEIAGKSAEELARLGVAVEALHQGPHREMQSTANASATAPKN